MGEHRSWGQYFLQRVPAERRPGEGLVAGAVLPLGLVPRAFLKHSATTKPPGGGEVEERSGWASGRHRGYSLGRQTLGQPPSPPSTTFRIQKRGQWEGGCPGAEKKGCWLGFPPPFSGGPGTLRRALPVPPLREPLVRHERDGRTGRRLWVRHGRPLGTRSRPRSSVR